MIPTREDIESKCNSSQVDKLLDLSFIDGYYSLKIGKTTKVGKTVTFQLAGTNKYITCDCLFYKPSEDRWYVYKKKV